MVLRPDVYWARTWWLETGDNGLLQVGDNVTNMHAEALGIHDAGVVAFLRYMLTPDEQRWPRFRPVLLPVSDVSTGELRVHPDLVDRLVALDPPDGRQRLRMLMGAAVLVAESGVIYALAYSQRFLAVRLGAEEDHALLASTALDATDRHQPAERIASLGEGWVVAEPWRVASLASLRTVVASARDAARRKESPTPAPAPPSSACQPRSPSR